MPAGRPDLCCVCRYVTASSTSDLVPTLPWASLLSSLKRCFRVKRWGARGSHGGEALSSLSAAVQFQNSPEPDLEIVVCSGYGKNGALSVLQVRGGRGCGASWWELGGLTPAPIVLLEEHPAPGGDNL